jgi:hypothetical protein
MDSLNIRGKLMRATKSLPHNSKKNVDIKYKISGEKDYGLYKQVAQSQVFAFF